MFAQDDSPGYRTEAGGSASTGGSTNTDAVLLEEGRVNFAAAEDAHDGRDDRDHARLAALVEQASPRRDAHAAMIGLTTFAINAGSSGDLAASPRCAHRPVPPALAALRDCRETSRLVRGRWRRDAGGRSRLTAAHCPA